MLSQPAFAPIIAASGSGVKVMRQSVRALWMMLLLLVSPWGLAAEPVTLRGYVQEMIGSEAGPGVPQVLVSNGRDVVATDADGAYSIALREGDTLFVIKPAGYRVVQHAGSGELRFWQHHFPMGSPALRYGGVSAQDALRAGGNFVLLPNDRDVAKGPLDVLVLGDPQAKNQRDVSHYARDIVEPILAAAGSTPAAHLGLSLGDIVDDDLSLYPALNAVTQRLGVPWLHAPGNHDLDFDAGNDAGSLHTFRATFGADTFAWEEGQANFVVLDNVIYQPGQRPEYVGGLRDDQFAFLQAYLARADRDRLLVLAAHVPFFDPEPGRETFRRADRERLFALLKEFPKVLLLTAHTHMQMHHYHGAADGWQGAKPLHEYNVGTTCGAYWSGAPDAEGIPDSTMADGTPNGYARLTVDSEGRYALRWHVARDAALDVGIALHAPKVLRKGAFPAYGVYANVFMGHAGSVVEYRIDDGGWRPMRHVRQPDPRLQAENVEDARAESLRGYDRSPEAWASTHLWRGTLPTDIAAGEHRIEVRTIDPWRGELRARTQYRLDVHPADVAE